MGAYTLATGALFLLVLFFSRLVLLTPLRRQAAIAIYVLVLGLLHAEVLVTLCARWHLALRRALARGIVNRAH
jgi:hypothetical protein